MFSKLGRVSVKQLLRVPPSAPQRSLPPRKYSDLIPPNQYDMPMPKRLHLGYVLKVYWETIPLFLTTMTSVSLMVLAIIYAARNKVDVVFSARSRECISRTMDLRNPTVHKVVIINQRYRPWPEMADLLDKMRVAETRVMTRAQTCCLV